jgi:hypothetical protein
VSDAGYGERFTELKARWPNGYQAIGTPGPTIGTWPAWTIYDDELGADIKYPDVRSAPADKAGPL